MLSKCVVLCSSRNWTSSKIATWKLIKSEVPLDPKWMMSLFRDCEELHGEEISENIIKKEKLNVLIPNTFGVIDDGSVYYEQYNIHIGTLKTGDFVYVKNEGQNYIAQVDKIWVNRQGTGFIHGLVLLTPPNIPIFFGRQFFKQEVLFTNFKETVLMSKITGKCYVLEQAEYISCRPVEIDEDDVYLCESIYDESLKQIRELPKDSLKKYTHSPAINQDEFFFFRKIIYPVNIATVKNHIKLSDEKTYNQHHDSVSSVSSLVMPKLDTADTITEDSMDEGPPSVNSSDLSEHTLNTSTIISSTRTTSKKIKLVTGYILYTSDVREAAIKNNQTFGEISRIVGNEWCNLSPEEKITYEERANKLNDVNFPQWRQETFKVSLPPVGSELTWECGWDNCDWKFEDQLDCLDHAIADQYGHVQVFFAAISPSDVEFQCHWRGCLRHKKIGIAQFSSFYRLVRHVKEVHILKSPGKHVPLSERSKHVIQSIRFREQMIQQQIPQHQESVDQPNAEDINVSIQINRNISSPISRNVGLGLESNNNSITINKHPEPLFVNVPSRPTRVLHSQTYIKYIESLNPDYIPNWRHQLIATQENTQRPNNPNSLPALQWLGKGINNHENALWALRNYMMNDTMGFSKIDK